MAIDPNLITTVQVSELPPAPFLPESILAHQVGDILSNGTIQQLVDYVRAQSFSQPYEIKYLRPPNNQYILDNFDMNPGANQGLGKTDGLWNGWAICNGNNGTDNTDGQTMIGYGANYSTIGFSKGEEEHILTISEMPAHNHTMDSVKQYNNSFGTNGFYDRSQGASSAGLSTENRGGGQAHNNMQPSRVVLMIYKLP